MPVEQRGPGRWRAGQVRYSGLRAGLIRQQPTQSRSGVNRKRCVYVGHGLSAGAGWEGSERILGGLGETWLMEAGLRPTAKAVELPPDPKGARAPRLPDPALPLEPALGSAAARAGYRRAFYSPTSRHRQPPQRHSLSTSAARPANITPIVAEPGVPSFIARELST